MGPEKKVEKLIKKRLTQIGAWWFKVAADESMPPGIPDIIACINGRFVGIEVKAPNKLKNTSLAQKTQIELIRKAGGIAWVVNSLELFDAYLKQLEE